MVIKMLEEKKNINKRNDGEIVSLNDLVPKFHLLRKIDKSIDWKKIYPIVEGKYSKIGRPSVDPVVLVKMVMLQHIYGIRSLRQTVAEIEVNVAYRWFIGYGLTEKIPHFSTVSYNFLHRFDSEMFEEIFTLVLNEGIDSGYVYGLHMLRLLLFPLLFVHTVFSISLRYLFSVFHRFLFFCTSVQKLCDTDICTLNVHCFLFHYFLTSL